MVTNENGNVNDASFPQFDGASIDQIRKYMSGLQNQAFIVGGVTLHQIPSMHKVVAEVIWINPMEAGAVYPTGKDSDSHPEPVWSLSNKSLKKLARAAAISWDSTQSRRLDNGSDPDVVRYVKVCRIRDLDGSMRVVQESYALDLKARADEVYEAKLDRWYWTRGEGQLVNINKRIAEQAEKAKKDDKVRAWSKEWCDKLRSEVKVYPETDRETWAAEQARIEMIQKRKYAEQLAATGAESRCILSALALSRGNYYLSDLQTKPFVILKLVPDIDYANDPQARMMLVAMHTGLVDAAFGHGHTLAGFIGSQTSEQRTQIPAQATPAMITAHASEEEVKGDDPDQEVAEPETVAPDPDEPESVERELFDNRTVPTDAVGATVTFVTDGTANPSEAEFANWPRNHQVELLRTIQTQNKTLPKLDLEAAKDEGILRYYSVALRYIKASAERR